MSRVNLSLVVLTLLGWSAFWGISTLDLFEQVPEFHQFALSVGLTITAITLVTVLAGFFLQIILSGAFQIKPSGLVSAIVYSGLSLVAFVVLLNRFGVDVGAILTTSAILGAVIGLSLQSTLGSIIAGMSMSAEPLLKIGSAIVIENRTVFIEQKTWRHVVGRRLDNIRVIIPNSMLANMPVLVLPEDGPTRFDVFFHLPPDVPPQQVTDLLSQAFSDIEHLDATRAVMVTPIETQPDIDAIRYRIRLWARTYSQITILQGEVLRRAWYVLERANIRQPRHMFYESTKWAPLETGALETGALETGALETMIRSAHGDRLSPAAQLNIRQYRFAPSEILHFPASEVDRSMIIVEGQVLENSNPYFNPIEHGRSARPHLPPMGVQKLSTAATVRKIADRLAKDAGPVAEQLVRDALKSAKNMNGVLLSLSENIHEEHRRMAFLAESQSLIAKELASNHLAVSRLASDASGRILPDPELRAVTEVLAVTFSTEL